LKPIHQKVYKYGFNPNFNKMTKTRRRRWIRNQVVKQKEMQQGGISSQAPSEKNISVASSTQDDMECEETVPVKEDKNIYVGRYIPAQLAEGNYKPRSENVGPSLGPEYLKGEEKPIEEKELSLRPEYLRNDKKPVEEKEIKNEKPYETTRVYIGKKPKRKNQAKPEKLTEEAVSETAKSDLVETEKIEAVDTNIDAGEDLLEDEDDDGEKFSLSIGAIRKEEPT
jgi:hypothetical protein